MSDSISGRPRWLSAVLAIVVAVVAASALAAAPAPAYADTGVVTIYRLYNRSSGEHLYTRSETEVEKCVAAGWVDEGIGWYAPTSGTEVIRLYNPNNGEHLYTTSSTEPAKLEALGWVNEGVNFYSAGSGTAIYRLFNPNETVGTHLFTTSSTEVTKCVAAGWQSEGICIYGAYVAGTYIVGTDIPAGEYKLTCVSDYSAYYCVYSDTSQDDIVSNDNFSTCNYVTVTEGQVLVVKRAAFVAIADASPTTTLEGDGVYKVGFDLTAGTYALTATDSDYDGYWCIWTSSDAATKEIENNDLFENNAYVQVEDGEYLEISRATATWYSD